MRIRGNVFPVCTVIRCFCELTHASRAEAAAATWFGWTDREGQAVCKCHDPIKGFPCNRWQRNNPAQARFEFND
jgi:hypothetical protein